MLFFSNRLVTIFADKIRNISGNSMQKPVEGVYPHQSWRLYKREGGSLMRASENGGKSGKSIRVCVFSVLQSQSDKA